MPVYECYCPDCHTVFSFFSRRVDTETRPDCPRCARPRLARQASRFAISKRRGPPDAGGADGDLPTGMDEERMMQAFASMAGEMERLDDADPRQAARLMRRLFDTAGLRLGDGMAEAIRRMESGEDPESIDADLGAALAGEDPLGGLASGAGAGALLRRLRRDLLPAARDERWYPLRPAEPGPKRGTDPGTDSGADPGVN
jgi:putative FmdB family regulatory protein